MPAWRTWLDWIPSNRLPYTGAITAMAHEVGHLFLGPNSHSPVGIMSAGWKEDDLKQASQARLTFISSEAERVRIEVRRRQEQQRTTSASTLLK